MHLAGPHVLRLAFQMFVVVVGVLILSGAVQHVHDRRQRRSEPAGRRRRPGELVPQAARTLRHHLPADQRDRRCCRSPPLLLSRGDVYLLGEAYAFGVVWSFFLKSLGVLVLRYRRHDQEYKTPFNPRIAGHEIPVGLIITTSVLLLGGHCQPVLQADRHHLWRRLHRLPVHRLHDFRDGSTKQDGTDRARRARAVQPGHAAGDHAGNGPCASRLRAGGGARLQPDARTCRACSRRPT